MSDNTGVGTGGGERPLSSFWTTLESIIRPHQPTGRAANEATSSIESIMPRLNNLKPVESSQARLKALEELVRLSELFNFNEEVLGAILEHTSDLFKAESAGVEARKAAFEQLTQLYQKQVGTTLIPK